MTLNSFIKSNFLAGLVLVGPLVATIAIVRIILGWVGGFLDPLIRGTRLATVTANNVLLAQLLTLSVIVALITVLGYLAQRSVGQHLFGKTGQLVTFVPVVRTIYGSIRQMTTSVVNRQSDFESVVYVEYPREGVYQLGLKTGTSPTDVSEAAGESASSVFIPGSPNPTQGMLVMVPESQTYESELSVRAAIRLLMTTGMAQSDDIIRLDETEVGGGATGQQVE
ncbi:MULTISPECIES: DUF502 domain-containing protein [Haloarcula]|uniref:DUF502 domain-containing protein n=1 Tax=Haloarcula amylolytica JCM 13557 TaxID=1227452 RepID=M0KSI9_9EURY|nr:DUF502 domain-containing protein [Haloarcula amylolytica]EMA22710.1 hypothetical protein C442_06781 [Haloarcula amylolytica JCM 13557]